MTNTHSLPYDEALYAAWAETYDTPTEREERDAAMAGKFQPSDAEIVAAQDEALDAAREAARHEWIVTHPVQAFL